MRLSVQIEFNKVLDLVTRKDSVIVGRSNKCDLVIPHHQISSQHCKIEMIKDQFIITDLESLNGVRINNERIPPNVKVSILPEEQLNIGGLDCELSHHVADTENKSITNSLSADGDLLSTIRNARIDLNQPSASLELEKKKKSNRPRNPVTAHFVKEQDEEKKSNGRLIFLVLSAAVMGAAWYFIQHK
jgi:pSer/pThr/pTyr-binding forkhead associated (FHA) protein